MIRAKVLLTIVVVFAVISATSGSKLKIDRIIWLRGGSGLTCNVPIAAATFDAENALLGYDYATSAQGAICTRKRYYYEGE